FDMSIPLIMTGPGGDYTTQYNIRGRNLVRHVGQTLGQQPDTETGGSFAGYDRQPGRGRQQEEDTADEQSLSGPPRGGLALSSRDRLDLQADQPSFIGASG